jgi:hypothetical protein
MNQHKHPPNGTTYGITHNGTVLNNGHQGLVFILPKEMMARNGVELFFILTHSILRLKINLFLIK